MSGDILSDAILSDDILSGDILSDDILSGDPPKMSSVFVLCFLCVFFVIVVVVVVVVVFLCVCVCIVQTKWAHGLPLEGHHTGGDMTLISGQSLRQSDPYQRDTKDSTTSLLL